MSDAAGAERTQILEQIARAELLKEIAAAEQNKVAPEPTPAPERPEATTVDKAVAIAGGVQQAVYDANPISTAMSSRPWGVDSNVWGTTAKYLYDKMNPFQSVPRDFLTERQVDPKKEPGVNAARTFMEYVTPIGGKPKLDVGMDVIPALAAGGIDYLDKAYADDKVPDWLKPAVATTISLLRGKQLANKADPKTDARSRQVIERVEPELAAPSSIPDALRRTLWNEGAPVGPTTANRFNINPGRVRDGFNWAATPEISGPTFRGEPLASEMATALRGANLSGEKGSLADLTDSRDLRNLESATKKGSPERVALDTAHTERSQQALNQANAPFGRADPTSALPIARAATGKTLGEVDAFINKNTRGIEDTALRDTQTSQANLSQARAEAARRSGEAQSAEQASRTDVPPSQASKDLYDAWRARDKELSDAAAVKWRAADAEPPPEIAALQIDLQMHLDRLPPSQKADFLKQFAPEVKQISDWQGPQSYKEVGYLKSKLGEVAANAASSQDATVLTKMAGAMSDRIREYLSMTSPAYRDAVEATKTLYDSTRSGQMGKGVNNEAYETFANRSGIAGEAGGYMTRQMERTGSPLVLSKGEQILRGEAQRAPGGVDRRFLDTHADALKKYPALKQELESVVRRKEVSAQAEKDLVGIEKSEAGQQKLIDTEKSAALAAQKSRKSGLTKSVENALITKYGKTPETVVDSLLFGKDKTKDLGTLYRSLDKRGGGAGFKANIRDALMEKIVKTDGSINLDTKTQNRLVDSGVVTKAEMDSIIEAKNRTAHDLASRKAAAPPPTNPPSDVANFAASILAHMSAKPLAATQKLSIISAIKRSISNRMLEHKYPPKVQKRVAEFMANPEKYIGSIDNAADAEKVSSGLANYILYGGQLNSQENQGE